MFIAIGRFLADIACIFGRKRKYIHDVNIIFSNICINMHLLCDQCYDCPHQMPNIFILIPPLFYGYIDRTYCILFMTNYLHDFSAICLCVLCYRVYTCVPMSLCVIFHNYIFCAGMIAFKSLVLIAISFTISMPYAFQVIRKTIRFTRGWYHTIQMISLHKTMIPYNCTYHTGNTVYSVYKYNCNILHVLYSMLYYVPINYFNFILNNLFINVLPFLYRSYLSCYLSFMYCSIHVYYNGSIVYPNKHAQYNTQHIHSRIETKYWDKKINPLHTNYFQIVNSEPVVLLPVKPIYNNNVSCDSRVHITSDHNACESEDTTENINIYHECFNTYDQGALNNIDPDINYLNESTSCIDSQYYDDTTFRTQLGNSNKLSLFHLNIRSIPDHFIELTSYLDSLTIQFKIIAISETWLKPHHIEYNIPNYNTETEYRTTKNVAVVLVYTYMEHCNINYEMN